MTGRPSDLAADAAHAAQHDDHEQQARRVESRDQPGETCKRADAIFSDGEGHRPERADRRKLHHQGDDLEHHDRDLAESGGDSLGAVADHRQRNPKQNRRQQRLEDAARGQRRDERVGNDVEQEAGQRRRMRLFGIVGDLRRVEAGRVDVEPRTRADDIGDSHPDDQRQGREEQEISKGLGRDAPDRGKVAHARNAGDDGQENQRRDDHLDQLDECVAERFERLARGGREISDQHPEDDRAEYLRVKVAVPRALHGHWTVLDCDHRVTP